MLDEDIPSVNSPHFIGPKVAPPGMKQGGVKTVKTAKIFQGIEADNEQYDWSQYWPTGVPRYVFTAVAYFMILALYRMDKFRSWFLISILALLLQASLLFNEALSTPWLPITIVFVLLLMCILGALVFWNIKEEQDKLIAQLKQRNATQCVEELEKLQVLKTYSDNLVDGFFFIVFPLLAGTVTVLWWRDWAPRPKWIRGQRNAAIDKKIAAIVKKAVPQPQRMYYQQPYAGYGYGLNKYY
jgi:hypothetical protein